MGKFNFRRTKGARQFKKWSEWEIGDYVVGKLVDVSEDQFGKPNYNLEVIETSMELEANKNFCLNSNGSLNYKLEDVEIGTVVRVEYLGKGQIEKGAFKGKEFHDVDVMIADNADMKVEEADLPEESQDEEDYGL